MLGGVEEQTGAPNEAKLMNQKGFAPVNLEKRTETKQSPASGKIARVVAAVW
jgi:hypothetical protein